MGLVASHELPAYTPTVLSQLPSDFTIYLPPVAAQCMSERLRRSGARLPEYCGPRGAGSVGDLRLVRSRRRLRATDRPRWVAPDRWCGAAPPVRTLRRP